MEKAWGRIVWFAIFLLCFGCQQEMADQPSYRPLEPSAFFSDGRSSRHLVPGTVARGHLMADRLLETGEWQGRPAEVFPFPVTRQVLERGRERYDIFCTPCHDRVGTGEGMVVRRGYRRPPSLHTDRLREAPAGHFFTVMTSGLGIMPRYGRSIPPRDRWAIIGYIRALQLSQSATIEDVPAAERERLVRKARLEHDR